MLFNQLRSSLESAVVERPNKLEQVAFVVVVVGHHRPELVVVGVERHRTERAVMRMTHTYRCPE